MRDACSLQMAVNSPEQAPVRFAAGIDWSTTQSLSLGDNDFSPALVLNIDRRASSSSLSGQDASAPYSTPLPTGACLCQPTGCSSQFYILCTAVGVTSICLLGKLFSARSVLAVVRKQLARTQVEAGR